MKTILIIFCAFLVSCFNDNFEESINKIATNASEGTKLENKKWKNLKNKIKREIEIDTLRGVLFLDSLILIDKSLGNFDKKELLLLSSKILYEQHAYTSAEKQCVKAGETMCLTDPINLIYRARCLVHFNKLKRADSLLNLTLIYDEKYEWFLGNLYEIKGDSANAIRIYMKLNFIDSVGYSFCKNRIDSINSGGRYLDELDFSKIQIYDNSLSVSASQTFFH